MAEDKSYEKLLSPRAYFVMGVSFTLFTAMGLYKYFVLGSAMSYLDKFSIFCGFPFMAFKNLRSFGRRFAGKAKA